MYCVVPETKGKSCEEIRSLFAAATETPRRSKELFDSNNNPDADCEEKQKQSAIRFFIYLSFNQPQLTAQHR